MRTSEALEYDYGPHFGRNLGWLVAAGAVFLGAVLLLHAKPFTNTGERMEVFLPGPSIMMSVTADGGVEVPLPTDVGLPNFPDCEDLGPEHCDWKAKLRSTYDEDGETVVIETDLKVDGKVVAKGLLMRVKTTAYEQLLPLAEKGIRYGWVSHILVDKGMRGRGLGRLVWQATDVMLRSVVGSGKAVHVFVDQAGWGDALMRDIAESDIIYTLEDVWAYIVR